MRYLKKMRRLLVEFIRFRRHNGTVSALSFFWMWVRGSNHTVRIKVFDNELSIRPTYADWKAAFTSLGTEFTTITENFQAPGGALIVDAGGFIGTSVLNLALAYPNAKIVAIEPSKENYALLVENTAHLPNVTCKNAALASYAGKTTLRNRNTGTWGYTIVEAPADNKSSNPLAEVETITLDAILGESGNNEIFLLKMDIEGGENNLLKTSESWMPKTYIYFVELHERIVPGVTELFWESARGRFNFKPGGEKILSVRIK